MATILDRMKVAASKVEYSRPDGLTREALLRDEEAHGLDSIGRVEFLLALEEEFGIELPDEDLDKLETLGDLEQLVAQRTLAR